jgi:hypothetical protein
MTNKIKKNAVSRRRFIQSGLVLAAGLPVMRAYPFPDLGHSQGSQYENDGLFDLFQTPPVTAKPFVRWWWNGDKVTASEIVFDTSGTDKISLPEQPSETEGVELKGWTLRMEHVNGVEQQRQIDALFDMKDDESTRSFAGRLYYEKRLPDSIAPYHWLDLGKVHGVSEVMVGEENLGNRWYGRHIYRLPDNAGGKMLRIKVTTTQGNFLKSTPENKAGYVWTQYQQWVSAGMLGPVKLL